MKNLRDIIENRINDIDSSIIAEGFWDRFGKWLFGDDNVDKNDPHYNEIKKQLDAARKEAEACKSEVAELQKKVDKLQLSNAAEIETIKQTHDAAQANLTKDACLKQLSQKFMEEAAKANAANTVYKKFVEQLNKNFPDLNWHNTKDVKKWIATQEKNAKKSKESNK